MDDEDELAARYADLVGALLRSPVVAGFCYTQLTDTAQERNGLLYADRRPKVDPARIAAVNRQVSAAVPPTPSPRCRSCTPRRLERDAEA